MNAHRKVRAAAVQLNPVLDSADGTIARVLQAIADGAAQGVELMVFPETVVPYYPYFSFVTPAVSMGAAHLKLYEHAPTVPGPMTEAVSAVARSAGMVVVLGVNERDHGTLYNTQLVFDADGTLALKRRKITPTYHERMVWGMGDGAGLRTVETRVGTVGALACWEHYNPLARYALMTQHEQIHCSQFPGSLVGPIFAEQMEVTMRHHALESGCFVVNATAWLTPAQVKAQSPTPELEKAFAGGCYTAIISPEGRHLAEPLREGEGMVVADLDFALITKRKRMMDSVGHYARPELLSLNLDDRAHACRQPAALPAEPVPAPAAAARVAARHRADPRDVQDFAQVAALLRNPQGMDAAQGAYLQAIADLIEKSE
ncbi:MAG: Nit6803 family nitrilase [Panacagrimonas sp.]